ncbi:YjbH domain-containing protein [Sulfitobacter sp. SK012]|uniref:YjbH domain-containing protein n=1 Tax=Sulfitobacter sp. SK012 TaxID=1389005 RepID=UPI000E0A0EDD|nr:YjbH domain-containing protein [Sulfitobacter sp. SK012]AXI48442.1 YjbH domain-containing protein [Sulfitobacter sp. SK012]
MIARRVRNWTGGTACAALLCAPFVTYAQDPQDVFAIPDAPTLTFYGTPGLIDMPSGEAMPDGQFAIGISNFGGTTRTTLSFQATPRISASFRYVGIQNWNDNGFSTYRDRSFDVRFLLNRESRYLPSLTLGLQDFAGTGIYAGEFIAATKNFSGGGLRGKLKVTGGLGWGRLGSSGGIGSPFGSTRPGFQAGDTGGEPGFDQWFRGEVAPFGGVEWQVSDSLGLKAEYSSDAYNPETSRGVFTRKSRFNFGAEYQVSDAVRLGAYYLYGSELGVNVQVQLNPKRPLSPLRTAAPRPYDIRPSRSSAPEAYSGEWAKSESVASTAVRDALIPLLEADGLTLIEAQTTAKTTEVRFSNYRYPATSVAVGRVARAMARVLPASVDTFRIVPIEDGLAQSVVVFRRSDLERLEVAPNASDALLAVSSVDDVAPSLAGGVENEDLYPDFAWSIGPYLAQSYFDPDEPIRADAGIRFNLSYSPAPGWIVAGELRHRLVGNISDGRTSDSVLPHVRSDAVLYAQGGDTTINQLYVARQWKLTPEIYARVTGGYLESMFGGVSSEVLWKPAASRLAIGVEANYAMQRDFDQRLGFQDYSVATGHASAYYEFGSGYTGQLDVGRYLAGDVGATVTLAREFANGWKVGGYFTLTDVSSEDFGEGSFDKGITFTVPVSWFLGKSEKQKLSTTIQPVTRDGGARLKVPGRLYNQVRQGHSQALENTWSGVWE